MSGQLPGRAVRNVAEIGDRQFHPDPAASATAAGRLSTVETVPVDTPARRATSTSIATGRRAAAAPLASFTVHTLPVGSRYRPRQ
jgi:hypothetical protein